jgi:hypothetical protein
MSFTDNTLNVLKHICILILVCVVLCFQHMLLLKYFYTLYKKVGFSGLYLLLPFEVIMYKLLCIEVRLKLFSC